MCVLCLAAYCSPSIQPQHQPSFQPTIQQAAAAVSLLDGGVSCALLFVRLKPSVNTILNPSAAAVSRIFRIQALPNSDDVSECARAMRQCRQPLLRPALAPNAVLLHLATVDHSPVCAVLH